MKNIEMNKIYILERNVIQTIFSILSSISLALIFLILLSCSGKKESEHIHSSDTMEATIYYCPMDTQIVQTTPGTCPICGMDLELKPIESGHDSIRHTEWVYTPANESVLSTVKSVKPVSKSVPIKIKAHGYISYDDRRFYTIPAKVGGRIEKLYIKYNFQPVKKGQALFEIFSHDLQLAQQEYQLIMRTDSDATNLVEAAKKKLLLLGMTSDQINRIQANDHVQATTTVYSPHNGFVIEKQASAETYSSPPAGSMGNGSTMGNGLPMNSTPQEISLREGAYVAKGESVFTVANTDVVWAILELYSNQLNQVKVNQPVHIRLENSDDMIMGKINFIEPAYKEDSRTTKLRVYLDNKNQHLKIGSLLSGEVEAGEKKGIWVPQSSVYDLGDDKIVFVKIEGVFKTRKVAVGYSSEKEVEVISGLSEGEEIAENAQFMVDSESFIKIK